MKTMKCQGCGSTEFSKGTDGYLYCNYCRAKLILDKNEKVEKKSIISISSDIKNLLDKIEMDPDNASMYAKLILDIDPSNQQARKYIK